MSMGFGEDTQSWFVTHDACEQHSGSSQSVNPSDFFEIKFWFSFFKIFFSLTHLYHCLFHLCSLFRVPDCNQCHPNRRSSDTQRIPPVQLDTGHDYCIRQDIPQSYNAFHSSRLRTDTCHFYIGHAHYSVRHTISCCKIRHPNPRRIDIFRPSNDRARHNQCRTAPMHSHRRWIFQCTCTFVCADRIFRDSSKSANTELPFDLRSNSPRRPSLSCKCKFLLQRSSRDLCTSDADNRFLRKICLCNRVHMNICRWCNVRDCCSLFEIFFKINWRYFKFFRGVGN